MADKSSSIIVLLAPLEATQAENVPEVSFSDSPSEATQSSKVPEVMNSSGAGTIEVRVVTVKSGGGIQTTKID